ncbi:MAG: ABC transporter permease [Deltaproteobacteria bacterium]|nr:ABC transporter permease [Deltaproteobacteria bacterium]
MTAVFALPWIGIRTLTVWNRNRIVWMQGAWLSTVFGELFEPILYIFAFGYGLGSMIPEMGGMSYIHFIVPGALGLSIMYSSSFECTYGSFTRMSRQKTYEAVMLTPVALEEVVAGDIFWGATKGLIGGFFVVCVVSVAGLAQSPYLVLAMPASFLVGLTFAAMAQLVTALAPNYDFFTYYFTVVLTPMWLLSGAFFPVETLGPFWTGVAGFQPLFHAVTVFRELAAGRVHPGLLHHVAWLLLYAYVAFALSINLIKRRIVK